MEVCMKKSKETRNMVWLQFDKQFLFDDGVVVFLSCKWLGNELSMTKLFCLVCKGSYELY